LPLAPSALQQINELRVKYRGETEESVLLGYLFWTVIWNLEVPAEHLLEEFFEFSLAHPQYIKYRNRDVWLGHQANLAESLERRYPQQLSHALFAVWDKHRPSAKDFRAGLGFFIPTTVSGLRQYGTEFLQAAEHARERRAM
jgi:hypothetical protein